MVHVLEVLLEEGDVDDLAGDEGRVVEGGGEGFGVGVGAGTWRVDGLLEGRGKGYIYIQLWGTRGGKGGGEAGTNLRRYRRLLGWFLNSRTRWCRNCRLGSRRR